MCVCVRAVFIFICSESFSVLIFTFCLTPLTSTVEFHYFFHTAEKYKAPEQVSLTFLLFFFAFLTKALVEIQFPMIKVLKMYALNDQKDSKNE